MISRSACGSRAPSDMRVRFAVLASAGIYSGNEIQIFAMTSSGIVLLVEIARSIITVVNCEIPACHYCPHRRPRPHRNDRELATGQMPGGTEVRPHRELHFAWLHAAAERSSLNFDFRSWLTRELPLLSFFTRRWAPRYSPSSAKLASQASAVGDDKSNLILRAFTRPAPHIAGRFLLR